MSSGGVGLGGGGVDLGGGGGVVTPDDPAENYQMAAITIRATGTDIDENAFLVLRVSTPGGGWLNFGTGLLETDPEDPADVALVLTEDAVLPGIWRGEVEFDATLSGEFIAFASDNTDAIVYERRFWLVEGEPIGSLARREALIHTNTGGAGELLAETEGGLPVEGATVRVFRAADLVDPGSAVPVGVTATDSMGRWLAPIAVTAGETYTVVVQKAGVYGPVAHEVSV